MSETNFVLDLNELDLEAPEDSIVSRSLYSGSDAKVVLFGFAEGQSLSEHTASRPAILHVLKGEAIIVLGDETITAGAGTWAHMPANLPHSVLAQTQVVMLLTLLGPGS